MKAIILAAGYATRLYPLTLNTPKALLRVGNKPILDYIIDNINRIDCIDEIIVVSNHKFYDNFVSWKDDVKTDKTIKIINDGTIDDETKLGAIGDINLVIKNEGIDDDIFIIAGDNLFTFTLDDYFENYKSLKKDCVLGKEIDDINLLRRMGVASIDETNRIVDFKEKPQVPESKIALFASYIYLKETLPLFKEYIDGGNNPDAPGYFIGWLHKRKEVYTYIIDGECYDIGTPETYEEVQGKFKAL